MDLKRAVVFYSLSGNTKEAAKRIASELEAEIIEAELVKPMPEKFWQQILVGGMQSSCGMKPKVKNIPADIADYDEIIIGGPIWAGKLASPLNTVIGKYNIADKITAVFTLSGGGDNDKCIEALAKVLKNMKCNVALADKNNELASQNDEKIAKFVADLGTVLS